MATPKKHAEPKPATPGLEVRRTAEGSHYEAGVDYNGAWLSLGAFSVAGVDAAIKAAQDAKTETSSGAE